MDLKCIHGDWLDCEEGYFRHYENTPIQIQCKFYRWNYEIIKMKNCDIFLIFAQNIDCGYSLEPPRWGGSNEYPQSMFSTRNKKK